MVNGMNKRVGAFLDNLVIAAIVLVLIQTFLEDYAVVAGWPWNTRRVLIYLGFAFDVFFTIEFLVRLYYAYVRRELKTYFVHQRGWIDLLASVPLLLFNSGPRVYALIAGGVGISGIGGIMNVLKVVKAIRIARVLRLLRILKIFARIKHTESRMAQRHVATITTIAVTVFVGGMLVFSVFAGLSEAGGLDVRYQRQNVRWYDYILSQNLASAENQDDLQDFADANKSILLVKQGGSTQFTQFDNRYFEKYFGPTDYVYTGSGGLGVFFDLRPVNQEQSRTNLMSFVVIVGVVLAYMLIYSPHFAITVTDPLHIMRRGMDERGYNLEVKVPRRFADDEVYRLARLYNEVYLPLKDRTGEESENAVLDLDMDDIRDMLDEPS